MSQSLEHIAKAGNGMRELLEAGIYTALTQKYDKWMKLIGRLCEVENRKLRGVPRYENYKRDR